ncbi:hypothetical protein [Nocardia africana]
MAEFRSPRRTGCVYERICRCCSSVVYTDPQAASVGVFADRFDPPTLLVEIANTATYTHTKPNSNCFVTLLEPDDERLSGACALCPEASRVAATGNPAVRAHVPIDTVRDVSRPFPTFSEIYVSALNTLHGRVTVDRQAASTTRPTS